MWERLNANTVKLVLFLLNFPFKAIKGIICMVPSVAAGQSGSVRSGHPSYCSLWIFDGSLGLSTP